MNTIIAAQQGTNIAPLLLSAGVLGLLFFLMIVRPQKKSVQRQKELVDSLSVGEEVITSSGIYGSIVSIDKDTVELCIAKGVNIIISVRALAMKKAKETIHDQEENKDADTKEQE